ncbi:MAG TPA: Flp pilus assembly protein CpaB [Blastocatellia bacterium]|nr:Flp pilus assembly protein CpaB [Blastocatellia bacterium]
MNRRFVLALVASAVFGLLAIWVFRSMLQTAVDKAREGVPNQIVFATTKIPAGTTITPQHVKMVPYSTSSLPEGAIRSTQDVIGKIAQTDLEANLPVRAQNIATTKDSRLPLVIRPGYRAMSIRVDEATSVSGFATPGSIVDVQAVITPSANSKPVAKTIVQYLRVLATGRETQASEAQGKMGNTVTLEVTPAQAGMLNLAMREGTLSLILRHPADKDLEDVPTIVTTHFIEDYKNDPPRPAPTPITTSVPPFGPYWMTPTPTPKVAPLPTPTVGPTQKMAAVKVYEGTKETMFNVRQ